VEFSSVKLSRPEGRPHVLLITIDRPPVNAMTVDAHRELRDALRSVEDDASVRCIVLTGAGDRAFVAGGDVGELGALDPERALHRTRIVRQVFDAIRRNPLPVIAAVNGHALGSGLVIVSQCDVVVAAENASFGLPEIAVGVMGGTKHLARIVPEKVMRWMALTGRRVDAHYLARLGVIHQVVPREQVLEAALQVADDICAKSPAAVRLMKEVINLTEPMDLENGYHVETYATAIMSTHPDSKEAALAFQQKRAAKYANDAGS
jgi:enoyl-CoA hydratase